MTQTTDIIFLAAGSLVDAEHTALPLEALPEREVREGSPQAGSKRIDAGPGLTLGIWEMTAGVAVDIEVDECFIVLTGRATVTIYGDESEGAPGTEMELMRGAIVRLAAGMRTKWVVHEDLRKVYLMPSL